MNHIETCQNINIGLSNGIMKCEIIKKNIKVFEFKITSPLSKLAREMFGYMETEPWIKQFRSARKGFEFIVINMRKQKEEITRIDNICGDEHLSGKNQKIILKDCGFNPDLFVDGALI